MAAGISSEKKKVYFSRIGIFDEAFRTKVFSKINLLSAQMGLVIIPF